MEQSRQRLLDFDWLYGRLLTTDVHTLLEDLDAFGCDRDLRLLQDAIRLSAHVLEKDSSQLAGQLIGRLMTCRQPDIDALLDRAKAWTGDVWRMRSMGATAPRRGGVAG